MFFDSIHLYFDYKVTNPNTHGITYSNSPEDTQIPTGTTQSSIGDPGSHLSEERQEIVQMA